MPPLKRVARGGPSRRPLAICHWVKQPVLISSWTGYLTNYFGRETLLKFLSQTFGLVVSIPKKLGRRNPNLKNFAQNSESCAWSIFRNAYFFQSLFWRFYVVAVLVTLKPDSTLNVEIRITMFTKSEYIKKENI